MTAWPGPMGRAEPRGQLGEQVARMFWAAAEAVPLAEVRPPGPAEAVEAVRRAIASLWPHTSPEAVRDTMAAAANSAVGRGMRRVPEPVAGALGGHVAQVMLEFAASPAPLPHSGLAPAVAFASSQAFDREEDEETFAATAILLALAWMPQ